MTRSNNFFGSKQLDKLDNIRRENIERIRSIFCSNIKKSCDIHNKKHMEKEKNEKNRMLDSQYDNIINLFEEYSRHPVHANCTAEEKTIFKKMRESIYYFQDTCMDKISEAKREIIKQIRDKILEDVETMIKN